MKTNKLLLCLMLSIFLVGTVTALEIDNKKIYDAQTKTVTIKNSFLGIPTSEVAQIKLETPLVNNVMRGQDRKVWEITIDNADDYNEALRSMKLYNNWDGKEINREFTYKYKIISGYNEVDDYQEVCSETIYKNGTDCQSKVVGSHPEEIIEWVDLDTSQPLPKGQITIAMFTDVLPFDNVEWIPTFFGVEIKEWATWTDNFNNKLLSYYKLDEGSGTTAFDSLTNGTNGANTGATVGVAGIIATAYDFESGDTTDKIEYTSPQWCLFDSNDWTLNFWFKPESSTTGQQIYGCDGSALIVYFEAANDIRIGKATVDNAAGSTFTITDGVMTMVTIRKNATGTYYNKNGGSLEFQTYTTAFAQGTVGTIGNGIVGAVDGVLDEIGIWNRTLNASEVTDLYNAGAGITFFVSGMNGTLINPADNYNTSSQNFTFTANITDNSGVSNVTFFLDGVANQTDTSGANGTYNFTKTIFTEGTHTWSVGAKDNSGNSFNTSTRTFIVDYPTTISYTTNLIEGDTTTIYFNFTSGSIVSTSANVTWNGTNYTMSLINNNGTLAQFSRSFTIPDVTINSNLNSRITYYVNSYLANTTNFTQTIFNVPPLVVSASCTDKAIKFDLKDEANLSVINGTFQYNFRYGTTTNNTISEVYGNITNVNTFYVCINATISNSWVLGDGMVFYSSSGYVDRRYYLFDGMALSNATQNITLYDLASADQTSFKLEIEDTSLTPYVNKFTTLVRWYPDLNQYNVVDMGLTDETGSTVIHVRTEDVDYRIGVYERNGTLINLADPIRMVCLVSPCTYTLKISPGDTDYTSFLNIDYSFTFNETTGIWSFVFSDSSQRTSLMNMTVYKLTGTSVYPICSANVTGASGAMTCNTSIYTGNLKGVVERSASPPVPIVQKLVSIGSSAFQSKFGLFLSLLIAIPIIFIFAFMTPIGAVIGGVISLIPALYFGAISWVVVGGFAILAGITLHFLKRI